MKRIGLFIVVFTAKIYREPPVPKHANLTWDISLQEATYTNIHGFATVIYPRTAFASRDYTNILKKVSETWESKYPAGTFNITNCLYLGDVNISGTKFSYPTLQYFVKHI